MSLDVVIVTHNSERTVGRAVRSVLACRAVSAVIVVDNASQDNSVREAQAAGAGSVIVNTRNRGFAAGVNRGLMHCSSPFVLLLNPDAAIDGEALLALVADLTANEGVAMAGPVLERPCGHIELGARRFSSVANRVLWHVPWPRRPGWATPDYPDALCMAASGETFAVDYLWGTALLLRRSFLERIGGLDERFFLYSEDEDLGRQAWSMGLGVHLVTAARARHIGGASTTDKAVALARILAANRILLEKWEGRLRAGAFWRLIPAALVLRSLVLFLSGRDREARESLRARRLLDLVWDDPALTSGCARVSPHRPADARPGAACGAPWEADWLGDIRIALGYVSGLGRVAMKAVRRLTINETANEVARATTADGFRMSGSAEGGERPQSPRIVGWRASGRSQRGLSDQREGGRRRPIVSVILPTYNALAHQTNYLTEALDSISAQTCRSFELLVVDDGSTDGTPDLVTEYLADHPDITWRLLKKANGGQSSARNQGAREAVGDWLAFLDQDDRWYPKRLEVVLACAHTGTGPQVDLVYTDADIIDERGRVVHRNIHRTMQAGGGHPKRRLSELLFRDVYVMPGVMLIRRSFFLALGGFDELLSGYEDDDLFVRAFGRGRIVYVPRTTLQFRINPESASHSRSMVVSGLRYWDKLKKSFPVDEYGASTERRIGLRFARVFLSYASAQLVAGNPLFRENLAAADIVLSTLSGADRAAYRLARWAWMERSFWARCVRSWFLNGLQEATHC